MTEAEVVADGDSVEMRSVRAPRRAETREHRRIIPEPGVPDRGRTSFCSWSRSRFFSRLATRRRISRQSDPPCIRASPPPCP
jgi:hypothetical protein